MSNPKVNGNGHTSFADVIAMSHQDRLDLPMAELRRLEPRLRIIPGVGATPQWVGSQKEFDHRVETLRVTARRTA